jgi:hypothetical protein
LGRERAASACPGALLRGRRHGQDTEYEILFNEGTNDKATFCSDVQQTFSINQTSFPPNGGHGNVSWCNSNGCSGGGSCFE